MKSKQKYNQIISKKMITQEDIQIELETLSQQTKIKIENCQINDKQYYKEELQQFTEQCQHYSYVSKDEYQIIEENDEKTPNDINIDEIVRFYSFHHLYLKKTQIIEEVNQYPFILKFYIFYSQINDIDDKEEKIKKLEELVFDIKETGIKKKESLRRLLIIAQKEIEDIVNKEIVKDESDNELETVEDDIDDGGTIIQIGKFQVLSESAKKSPVNIQKLVQLLCPESQTQINELENLVFQIGYDKVYSYLLKSQFLSIENLSTINRLDRQLRFEYQHILEDIEMYFRSSLTYFITNKYDYQYIIPQTHQTFYKRGYLMNSIFLDGDDHYTLVKQLRERIDMEMKNQNLKLINEFKNHKYAISFSSAANIMPLGWVMSMFDNLNYHDKVEYLNCYYSQLTPQTFSSWMNNLTILRNRCAHYHSLYRLSSLKELRPIMTKACDSNGYDDDLKHSSLFYYTLVMTRLAPDIYNIEDFIDGVGVLFRKTKRSYADFNLQQDYSFPKNWRTMLENEKCVKMRNNESQR